ncbi:MAG: acylneuraminate cytidylyltransferase family protein [Eubacterium sp.]|nr:acylneuraminate cytidylyltransferase family protein [Eubacterium sp.]
MTSACFIPIKSISERVIGKNFRILNGKKLYQYIIENAVKADCFDEIFVDTNSDEIKEFAKKNNVKIIERKEELAKNSANGNDLLVHHYELFPDFDLYFQLFATAPFLQPKTIRKCFEILANSSSNDSCFVATENKGFFWMNNNPVNYSPYILPRSQDLPSVYEETTGLYGITNEALNKYRCRIGKNPYIHIVSKFEAVDINTEEDLKIAEVIGKTYWNL